MAEASILMRSTGAQSSNESQWLDLKIGHQDRSTNYHYQGDMPYLKSCAFIVMGVHLLWWNLTVHNIFKWAASASW